MKKYFYVTLFVLAALFITGCASQPSPESALIGSAAPEFILDNALGGQTALSDYEGTPVLLFFHMAVG
jgi:cytochrome oxidase Cu insertion factor (SCO1/SenC/PrrC family)